MLAVHFQLVGAMCAEAVELSPRGLLDLILSLLEPLNNSVRKNVLIPFEACKLSEWLSFIHTNSCTFSYRSEER